jgi:hypothetical protein
MLLVMLMLLVLLVLQVLLVLPMLKVVTVELVRVRCWAALVLSALVSRGSCGNKRCHLVLAPALVGWSSSVR